MSLIPELQRLQARAGYLRDEDLRELSYREKVPLHRIEEVVSFYPHFRRKAPPRAHVEVCHDLACWLADGEGFCAAVRDALADADDVEVREVSCLGRCEHAPAVRVNGVTLPGASADEVARLARDPKEMQEEAFGAPGRWQIDFYADGEGSTRDRYAVYRAYRDRDREVAAEEVIGDIEVSGLEALIGGLEASGLRGMGGAGFPTGRKWRLVRDAADPVRYVICNADESEPGTFKDRAILAELPHLVIEGMCLAALAVGARKGWIYLRHEYEPERRVLERALEEARAAGVLGEDFDIEVFVSPGGYILGEETALLEALEDRRGEPRNKPPYPGQKGLEGRPTLINNVETLALVPAIVARGADWWRSRGVRGHTGLKIISVSGHVERPGVYEIPMGTTVAELIERAGGVKGGRALKAFAPGGASSEFLPADRADVEIDFDSIQKAGSMLGSGALVVIAEGTDMIAAAANVVRFFRNESCGKCVPCRSGTEKVTAMLEEILARKGNGSASGRLRETLPRLQETLGQTSICGLGQVALNPLASALEHWGSELDDV